MLAVAVGRAAGQGQRQGVFAGGQKPRQREFVRRPEGDARRLTVDSQLGHLLPGQEMAELTVNGQPAGVSFWPPHKFPLAGLLTPGENALTLTLTGSPANRYGKHPVPYGLER